MKEKMEEKGRVREEDGRIGREGFSQESIGDCKCGEWGECEGKGKTQSGMKEG